MFLISAALDHTRDRYSLRVSPTIETMHHILAVDSAEVHLSITSVYRHHTFTFIAIEVLDGMITSAARTADRLAYRRAQLLG